MKELKKGNGFKRVDVNTQEKISTNNPLVSVYKLKNDDSALKVKGQVAPRPKNEDADGHLNKRTEMKHKENPHFPLRKSDDKL